ncbi:MAG: hypothetical protein ABUK15_07375 [Anaerolineales bacterium]
MQYKSPDIKTADVFFEILSNPKKTLEHIAEMRKIRDDIAESLGAVDTKAKADKLFREASAKMTEAKACESKVLAEHEAMASELSDAMEKHGESVDDEREKFSAEKAAFASAKGQFTRTSTALKADLEKREAKVTGREEAASGREDAVGVREEAVNAVAKQMTEAKETMARIRPV